MTKFEIIDETVEFYKNNPRSLDEFNIHGIKTGNCVYLSNEGNKCGFSRCCTDEGVKILHEKFDINDGTGVQEDFLQFLKPEYQGHNLDFWKDIQSIHDSGGGWEKSGNGNTLTDYGIKFVNRLKEKYINK